MKHFLALLCALLMFSCSERPEMKLPELSAEKAESLVEVTGKNIWMSSFKKEDIRNPPPALQPAFCADIHKFNVQILYPITICRPPDIFVEATTFRGVFDRADTIAAQINSLAAGATKMSGTSRIKVLRPFWCRDISGPWVATVREEQQCNNVNAFRTVVEVLGIPQPLVWIWWGRFDDRAAEFGLQPIGGKFGESVTRIDCNPNDLTQCN